MEDPPPLRVVVGTDAHKSIMVKIKQYGENYQEHEKTFNRIDVDSSQAPYSRVESKCTMDSELYDKYMSTWTLTFKDGKVAYELTLFIKSPGSLLSEDWDIDQTKHRNIGSNTDMISSFYRVEKGRRKEIQRLPILRAHYTTATTKPAS
ncbi:uncharacterized protein L3040_007723 [Drepanopeziza brunnea f. sp. 'multigermtubi']|nr:hypothetical protein L3040_007723 [Drepanopeziza brunnea f. sp. 'multigermtubi']